MRFLNSCYALTANKPCKWWRNWLVEAEAECTTAFLDISLFNHQAFPVFTCSSVPEQSELKHCVSGLWSQYQTAWWVLFTQAHALKSNGVSWYRVTDTLSPTCPHTCEAVDEPIILRTPLIREVLHSIPCRGQVNISRSYTQSILTLPQRTLLNRHSISLRRDLRSCQLWRY
jgi:hypothetical protein